MPEATRSFLKFGASDATPRPLTPSPRVEGECFKRRSCIALIGALLLSACAFGAERSLFSVEEAVYPFADEAAFVWRMENEKPLHVRYRRVEGAYVITQEGNEDEPMLARFVPVPETPEDDYIVETKMGAKEDGRVFAFLWREAGADRIFFSPGGLSSPAAIEVRDRICAMRQYGECQLHSAAQVRALYLEAIYPYVVRGGEALESLIAQTSASN